MSINNSKRIAGQYEANLNILHLWFPSPILLRDVDAVTALFDEAISDWIEPTPGRFYLLVNYENLHIAGRVADCYASNIKRFQPKLLGTFRYGIPADFTGVAVSLGNLRLQAPANLFENEAAARAAIDAARPQSAGRIAVTTNETLRGDIEATRNQPALLRK
jgi:hypothetical protein